MAKITLEKLADRIIRLSPEESEELGLILRAKALNHILQTSPDNFYQGIMNQSIITVLRKGKYIIMPLSK